MIVSVQHVCLLTAQHCTAQLIMKAWTFFFFIFSAMQITLWFMQNSKTIWRQHVPDLNYNRPRTNKTKNIYIHCTLLRIFSVIDRWTDIVKVFLNLYFFFLFLNFYYVFLFLANKANQANQPIIVVSGWC